MQEKIAVIGLGYVGLPVAVALARAGHDVVGFDISTTRVATLRQGRDWTGEVEDQDLVNCGLRVTDDSADLTGRSFHIVTVPTPIDHDRRPDLSLLRSACETLAPALSPDALVVFESTVYPGVTEEFCGPLLEQLSGLRRGKDFFLGYSPERINPGDKEHRLETITKIIAAENPSALERVRNVYGSIIRAGLHVTSSIKVAEAAKVIENTQRDINIALMNEIALIFDRMGIPTREVLEAAGTKWNFLRFSPGLVGGHCIGVDPYYLTAAAEKLGYHPEVILAGRRVNDGIGQWIAQKAIKLLITSQKPAHHAKVGILGLTFKENVPDLRNSKVPDIYREMLDYGLMPIVHDPHADPDGAVHEYGIVLSPLTAFKDLDILIIAVNHADYHVMKGSLWEMLAKSAVVIDIKSMTDASQFSEDVSYWSL